MVLVSNLQNGIHGMLEFIEQTPIPQSDLDFFSQVPHLKYYLSDPAYTPAPFYSLYVKPNNPTSDLFFAKTIRSDDTIPHCLLLLKKGEWPLPQGPPQKTQSRPFPSPEVPDVTILYDLKDGMNGFAHTAHGGAMCSLLDETLGMCAEVHRQTQYKSQRTNLYTAQLNTSFLAPVETPGVVRIKAWCVGAEGRKWHLRAQMDDGRGKVLLETESLWISVREEGSL
jgi:hypothetical protein